MGTGSYSTWMDFEVVVTAAFKGGAQMEIAQAKMEQLHQNSTTAMEYFTMLDTLNHTTGYDETTLIQLLKRGIEQPVIEKIYG